MDPQVGCSMDSVTVKYFRKLLVMSSTSFTLLEIGLEKVDKVRTLFFLPSIILSCEFLANSIVFNKNLMEQKLSKIFSHSFFIMCFPQELMLQLLNFAEERKKWKKLCC